MKKLTYCILKTAIPIFLFFSCSTNDTSWQKDFGAFVKTMTDLGSKSYEKKALAYNDRFKNKEVVWELNFKEVGKNKYGEEELNFDLQSFGINGDPQLSSDQPVSMIFQPAPGTFDTWKNVASGSQVKISATISEVLMIGINSGSASNPGKSNAVAIVSLNNVKKAQD